MHGWSPGEEKSKTIGREKTISQANTELHTRQCRFLVSQKMTTTKVSNYKPGVLASHVVFIPTSKSSNNLPFSQVTHQNKIMFGISKIKLLDIELVQDKLNTKCHLFFNFPNHKNLSYSL